MLRHVSHVASGFQAAGLILGIPSLLALLCFGGSAIALRLMSAPPVAPSGDSPPSLVSLLVDGARIVGKVFGLVGTVGQTVFTILAAVALVLLAVAGALYLTGRGLHGGAVWARILAILFSGVTLLLSALGLLSTRRIPGALIFGPAAAASVYALLALLRRTP